VQSFIQQASRIVFSPIVLGELHAGFQKGVHARKNQDQVETFMSSPRVPVAVVDRETALRHAEILHYWQDRVDTVRARAVVALTPAAVTRLQPKHPP
jgi:predicted nucleic acid-binding protein